MTIQEKAAEIEKQLEVLLKEALEAGEGFSMTIDSGGFTYNVNKNMRYNYQTKKYDELPGHTGHSEPDGDWYSSDC